MSPEPLDLGSAPTLRAKLRLGALVGLVAVLVVLAVVLVQNARAQRLTPAQARTALSRSFPDRPAAFPLRQPEVATSAPVDPSACAPLLLRPWLVDAWPASADSGSQIGPPPAGALPASDVTVFTFPYARDAAQIFAAARRTLDDRSCADATVRPIAAGAAPFTVALEAIAPAATADRTCDRLAFRTTVADPPAGMPAQTTTQLLRYGNTVSWQVQRSADARALTEDGPVVVGDQPPSLADVCRQLRALGAAG